MLLFKSIFAALLLLFLPYYALAQPPINIVVSFSILGDMTRIIAKDNINLTVLVGPEADAHIYTPTPSDIKALAKADLVIINGLGFEGWMERLIESAGFHGTVVVASNGVNPLSGPHGIDPHAWQDIAKGEIYVRNIRDALLKADPEHAKLYIKNTAAYLRKLTELNIWVKEQLETIPPQKRRAITTHDALHYFADAYGVIFISPQGLSTGGEVSAGNMAHLIDQMRNTDTHTVFLENMTDSRLIRQLAQEGGAVIGGTLYSDALSVESGPASNYIDMFHHNVAVMVEAMNH